MRRSQTLLALILLAGAAAFFLLRPAPEPGSLTQPALPWQIEVHADGTSSVFGLHLEHTRVDEALALLGPDHELAIIDGGDNPGLEIYYSHFRSGPLQAKLILGVAADSEQLQAMQARASQVSVTSTGARKILLHADDLARIQSFAVATATLIPGASLDHDIIEQRFGRAPRQLQPTPDDSHYLYPNLGLSISLHSEGKELLQYVAPRAFPRLSQALQQPRD